MYSFTCLTGCLIRLNLRNREYLGTDKEKKNSKGIRNRLKLQVTVLYFFFFFFIYCFWNFLFTNCEARLYLKLETNDLVKFAVWKTSKADLENDSAPRSKNVFKVNPLSSETKILQLVEDAIKAFINTGSDSLRSFQTCLIYKAVNFIQVLYLRKREKSCKT